MNAEQFFYEHGAFSYNPATQTLEQGRRESAAQLATAERWLTQQPGHTVQWLVDEDADRSGIDHDEPLYGCVVTCPGRPAASLWSIDLGAEGSLAHPYTRVVVAQLALELMPEGSAK